MDVNSLTGTHKLLFEQTQPTDVLSEQRAESTHPWYCDNPYNPFENSDSTIRCYNCGDYLPILQHNLADIHRTWELGELVREFISSKDLTTKKL